MGIIRHIFVYDFPEMATVIFFSRVSKFMEDHGIDRFFRILHEKE